jgi:hypothetical protein
MAYNPLTLPYSTYPKQRRHMYEFSDICFGTTGSGSFVSDVATETYLAKGVKRPAH